MKLSNFNRSLFFITLALSVGFAALYYIYHEDRQFINMLFISVISLNLAISFVFFIIANRKTRHANQGYEQLSESSRKKTDILKDELCKTKQMLKENSKSLDELAMNKQEIEAVTALSKAHQDTLLLVEENLDTMLSNISRNLEINKNTSALVERLSKELKKHNNILANIDYNIINLNNEKDNPNKINLAFITGNIKEIRIDLEQLSGLMNSNISSYSDSIRQVSAVNSRSLSTLESLLDSIKPLNRDFAKNYRAFRELSTQFNSAFETINKLAKIIKDFQKEIEYFIDNFCKNN